VPPITVVIADQDKARRTSCLRLLRLRRDIRVLGQARSGLEALAATRLRPQVLLLDLSLSRGHGSDLLPAIRKSSPGTKIILVAGRASETRILEGLCHGARGYLDKRFLRTFLAKAVRLVGAGQAWVSRGIVPGIVDRLARPAAQA
jgi:DNA-binding NarL/FixJ family response regulator